jgi:hypothetical protein
LALKKHLTSPPLLLLPPAYSSPWNKLASQPVIKAAIGDPWITFSAGGRRPVSPSVDCGLFLSFNFTSHIIPLFGPARIGTNSSSH